MLVAIDTGILLRLLERTDAHHPVIWSAVRQLRRRRDQPVTSAQNIAEFWNVCTRPASSRGGFGLSTAETHRRLQVIERLMAVLPDAPASYAIWRQLVVDHGVQRAKVHDARLVAWMKAQGIFDIVTMNPSDFARYAGLTVATPETVVAATIGRP